MVLPSIALNFNWLLMNVKITCMQFLTIFLQLEFIVYFRKVYLWIDPEPDQMLEPFSVRIYTTNVAILRAANEPRKQDIFEPCEHQRSPGILATRSREIRPSAEPKVY